MKIKPKFNFLQRVQLLNSTKIVTVTDLQIKADGSLRYGCMNEDGGNEWYLEYELTALEDEKSIGLTIEFNKQL